MTTYIKIGIYPESLVEDIAKRIWGISKTYPITDVLMINPLERVLNTTSSSEAPGLLVVLKTNSQKKIEAVVDMIHETSHRIKAVDIYATTVINKPKDGKPLSKGENDDQ